MAPVKKCGAEPRRMSCLRRQIVWRTGRNDTVAKVFSPAGKATCVEYSSLSATIMNSFQWMVSFRLHLHVSRRFVLTVIFFVGDYVAATCPISDGGLSTA